MELFADYVTTPGIVPSSACNPTTLASKHPRQPDDVARLPWFELDIRGVCRRSMFSWLLMNRLAQIFGVGRWAWWRVCRCQVSCLAGDTPSKEYRARFRKA